MATRKGLDRQMDPLVPFEIVIPVEALRTLITFERTIILRRLLMSTVVHLLHVRRVPTIKPKWHLRRPRSTYQLDLAARVPDVGKYMFSSVDGTYDES